jgi:hypothetical protein
MSVSTAQKIVQREHLRFGDDGQIEALEILALVEQLKSLGVEEIDCPRCNGSGYRYCLGCTLLGFPNCDGCILNSDACAHCTGRGTIEIKSSSELTAHGLRSLIAQANGLLDTPAASAAAAGGAS